MKDKKKCIRCEEEKDLCCFHKKEDMRSGLKPYCITCVSEYNKEYYLRTKERKRRYNKQYYQENKERLKQNRKE